MSAGAPSWAPLTDDVVVLDGRHLSAGEVADIASGRCGVQVPDAAWTRVAASHDRLLAARDAGDVYGANTGVGANRHVRLMRRATDSESGHAMQLLRSHCAGVGSPEPYGLTRAAIAVRLNQVLAGGSGISLRTAQALHDVLTSGSLPWVHSYGSIGTGDLAQLAEIGLTLAGERPWQAGGIPPVPPVETDALPLISSNAVTIARAALAVEEAATVLAALEAIAALSFLALKGSAQAWLVAPHQGRPHPFQADVAARLSRLLAGPSGVPPTGLRLQDPYGLRALPQVHAPAWAAVDHVRSSIRLEMNAAAENPLVGESAVYHHGQFHVATLAADLDHLRNCLVPVMSLSASRLSLLTEPTMTGLLPFLSDGLAGSSGLMMAEYVSQDALARLRSLAVPVTQGTLSISLGLEEHASFASHGARQLHDMLVPVRTMTSVEAVAAVRALQQDPLRARACPVLEVFHTLTGPTGPDFSERPMGDDVRRVDDLLPSAAALALDLTA